jgi:hypothetical protein
MIFRRTTGRRRTVSRLSFAPRGEGWWPQLSGEGGPRIEETGQDFVRILLGPRGAIVAIATSPDRQMWTTVTVVHLGAATVYRIGNEPTPEHRSQWRELMRIRIRSLH